MSAFVVLGVYFVGMALLGAAVVGVVFGLIVRHPTAALWAGLGVSICCVGVVATVADFRSGLRSAGLSPEEPGAEFWTWGIAGSFGVALFGAGVARFTRFLVAMMSDPANRSMSEPRTQKEKS